MTEEIPSGVLSGVPQITFYPELMMAFGLAGALIVQQVHYWTVHNPHHRDGHSWMFNSIAKWEESLKIVGRTTIVTTLKSLTKREVLITGRFNKLGFDRTLWYRVNYPKLAQILEETTGSKCQILAGPCAKFWHIKLSKFGTTIPKTSTKTSTKKTLATASPSLEDDHLNTLSPGDETMAKGPSTSAQLMAHLKLGNNPPPATPNTATSLERVFKSVAPKHNDMACIPSFTMKDKGQFGRLAKVSWKGKADEVMTTICSDWISFAKEVATQLGFSKYPLVPHLPFIVKYADHALAFHSAAGPSVQLTSTAKGEITLDEQNQGVTQVKKSKLLIIKKGKPATVPVVPSSPPAPVPDAIEEDEDAPLTLADLLAYKS